MPQFNYRGVDANGTERAGLIEAATQTDAVAMLAAQGLRVKQIETGAATTASPRQPRAVRPAPASPSASPPPRAPVSTNTAVHSTAQFTSHAPSSDRSYSPACGHKERNLLFGQLANLFQAGFSPAAAFDEMARRRTGPQREMFTDIARMCGEGRSLGESAAKYPGFFPPGIADALGAGEAGGYLPEACAWVAEQQAKTHGLNMFARFFHINAFFTALAFPFAVLLAIGSRELVHYVADFQGNAVQRLMGGISEATRGWPGVAVLLIAIGWIVAAIWIASPRQKPLRDSVFSRLPGVGKRSSIECFDVLTRHLSRLSNAGLTPRDAWTMAAGCAPNYSLRSRLKNVQAHEQSKLSDLMAQSGVVDRSLVDYVATGEIAGNIPGTLDQIANLNRDEIGAKEATIKKHITAWLVVVSIFVGMIPVAIFFRLFYSSMFEIILDDFMLVWPRLFG